MVSEFSAVPAVPKPALTIRSHLFLLALAAVVPVLAFAVAVSFLLIEQGREVIRNAAMDRARAMLTAIDAELRGSIRTLEALATSRALEASDLQAFHTESVRVLASQPSWSSINISLPFNLQQVANTARPFGYSLQALVDKASAEQVVRTGKPVVGSIASGALLPRPLAAVRVPVLRQGTVAYILTALVQPESFESLIRQQKLPDGWVIGIVDAKGLFVARLPRRDSGSQVSGEFLAAMHGAQQGWYRGTTVEGSDVYTAHMTSEFSNWTVGLAIPAGFVEGGARRTMWVLGLGALASVLLALLVAMLIGRRIAGPVVALATTARDIASGHLTPRPGLEQVREVAEVATALEHSAEAIREREQLIEREKTALLEADRAKDQFIAMLSHELRNPLSALTTAAHLLKLAGPGASASEHARGVIERQTRHMTRLIEDLLDINRVAMGKATLIREPLDLAELVSDVVRTWRESGRLDRHTVELAASPVTIDADRSRMEQVVSNLLENALKFTPSGRKVTVGVSRQGADAVLSVADEGEGIESAMIGRIFGLFVQGPQPLDRQSGGLGVGLALVRGLAELHGGSAEASSAGPGRGACFTVRIPALSLAALPVTAPGGAAVAEGRSRRIIIVEDNQDARKMLKVMLELTGNRVREAADAATGLKMAAEDPPDAMIVDIGLPDIDGYELASRIRAMHWGGRILLIALTGYGQAEDKRRALEAGFDAHATKPVLPEQLELLIEATSRAAEDRTA
jgi:signal transduction histidine kinase/ActR/RegA family two-component response regulator